MGEFFSGAGSGLLGIFDTLFGGLLQGNQNSLGRKLSQSQYGASLDFQKEAFDRQLDENERNRRWNKDFAFDMFNRENEEWTRRQEYMSPANMVQRYAAAGINPAAAVGGMNGGFASVQGAPMPTSPSAPTASSPSPTGAGVGVMPRSNISGAIGSIAQLVETLTKADLNQSESGKASAETRRISELLGHELNSFILKNKGQELVNASQSLDNFIKSEIKDASIQKAWSEVSKIDSESFLNLALGDKANIETDYTKFLKLCAEKMKPQEFKLLCLQVKWFEKEKRSFINNLNASASESIASASEHNASVGLVNAKKTFQDLENQIKNFDVVVQTDPEVVLNKLNTLLHTTELESKESKIALERVDAIRSVRSKSEAWKKIDALVSYIRDNIPALVSVRL